MVSVREVLQLPVLSAARVVAGERGLDGAVRWCHVAEVLDIARLLAGGELLLTTGLVLDVPPERQTAYVDDLHGAGVVGLMLELGRQFDVVPPALVRAADAAGLPLIALPFDTPFVRVTEAVHTLVLSRRTAAASPTLGHAGPGAARLVEELAAGAVLSPVELKRRLHDLGLTAVDVSTVAGLVADAPTPAAAAHVAGAAAGGHVPWLLRAADGEVQLLVLGPEATATAFLNAVARRLAPMAAGVGRGYREPVQAGRSLAEARQTMHLRRRRPDLSPLHAETGVYRLVAGDGAEWERFVHDWLGALLDFDRVRRADLVRTLRVLLDDGLTTAAAARHLNLTRQALYDRRRRIEQLLSRNLDDPEARLALAVALRGWDVLAERGDSNG